MRVVRAQSEAERHEARRRWLTTPEAAEMLGVSPGQIRALIAADALREMVVSRPEARQREYRIRPEWLTEYEERNTSGPTPPPPAA